MTHAATMAEIRHAWYGVHFPIWSPVMIGMALLLVLTAFAYDCTHGRWWV